VIKGLLGQLLLQMMNTNFYDHPNFLLSPDADPIRRLQFSGQQRGAEGEVLAVRQNHRGELWVL